MAAVDPLRAFTSQPGFDLSAPNYGLRRGAPTPADANSLLPTDAQINASLTPTSSPGAVGSFTNGLARSYHDIPAQYYGAKGLIEDAAGFGSAGAAALQHSGAITQYNADQYPDPVPTIGDIHGVGDAFKYAAGKVGSFIPQAVPFAVAGALTGGVGDVVDVAAGAAAKTAADAGLDEAGTQAAVQAARSAAIKSATPGVLAKQFAINTGIGAFSNAPSMAAQVQKQGNTQVAALKALGGDAAVSALQAVPITHLFGGVADEAVAGAVNKAAAKYSWVRRAVTAGAKDGATFGAINVASTAVTKVAHAWIMNQPINVLGPGSGEEYLNSLASGALLGMTFGAFSTPVEAAKKANLDAFGTAVRAKKAAFAGMDKVAAAVHRATGSMAKKVEEAGGMKPEATTPTPDDVMSQFDAFRRGMFDPTVRDSVAAAQAHSDPTAPSNEAIFNAGTTAERAAQLAALRTKLGVTTSDPVLEQWSNIVSSMLPSYALDPDQSPETAQRTMDNVNAMTLALKNGFSNLDKRTQFRVGKFLDQTPPELGGGRHGIAMRMLAASDKLAGNGELANDETLQSTSPDDVPEANDPSIQTYRADADEGDEANSEAEADEANPNAALSNVSEEDALKGAPAEPLTSKQYRAARFFKNQEKVPEESRIMATSVNKNGQPYNVALNAKTLTGTALSTDGFGSSLAEPRTQLLQGLTLVLSSAHMHGDTVDPASIRAGLVLSNDKTVPPLTESEAAIIRAGLVRKPPSPVAESTGVPLTSTGEAAPTQFAEQSNDQTAPEGGEVAAMQQATQAQGPRAIPPGEAAGMSVNAGPREDAPVMTPNEVRSSNGPLLRQFDRGVASAGIDRSAPIELQLLAAHLLPDAHPARSGLLSIGRMLADGDPEMQNKVDRAQAAATLFKAHGVTTPDADEPMGHAKNLAYRVLRKDAALKKRLGIGQHFYSDRTPEPRSVPDGDNIRGAYGYSPLARELALQRLRGDTPSDPRKGRREDTRPFDALNSREKVNRIARANVLAQMQRDAAAREASINDENAKNRGAAPVQSALVDAAHTLLSNPLSDKTEVLGPDGKTERFLDDGPAIGETPEQSRAPLAARVGSTIVDSLRATMEHPLVKQIIAAGSDLLKGAPDLPKEQSWVDHLTTGFGIGPIKLTELTNVNAGRNGHFDPNTNTISINSKLRGMGRVGTIAHEIGHAIATKYIDQMPPEMQQALRADFEKWRTEHASEENIIATRATRATVFSSLSTMNKLRGREGTVKSLNELNQKQHDYLYSFPEYMADQIARVLVGEKEGIGNVRSFFGKLGHHMAIIHSIAARIEPRLTDSVANVRQFVQHLWQPDRDINGMADASGPRENPRPATGEGGADTPTDQGPAKPATGEPADYFSMLNPSMRRALYEFLTRAEVVRQVIDKLPQLEDRALFAGTQMRTLINAAVALHLKGELDLAKSQSVTTSLKNLADHGWRAVGLKSKHMYAKTILHDFTRGEVQKSGKSYNAYANAAAESAGVRQSFIRAQNAMRKFHFTASNKLLKSQHDRMQNTANSGIHSLAAMFYQSSGEQGGDTHQYSLLAAQSKDKYEARVMRTLDGLKPNEALAMHEASMKNGPMGAGFEHLQPKLDALRKTYSDFYDYQRKAGVKIGKHSNPYSVVMDPDRVAANEGKLRNMLAGEHLQEPMRNTLEAINQRHLESNPDAPAPFDLGKMKNEDVQDVFYRMAARRPGEKDVGATDVRRPSLREASPRISQFLYDHGTPDDINTFNDLRSKDIGRNVLSYIRRGVRNAEYERAFIRTGADGKETDLIDKHLAEAKKDGASDSELANAKHYVNMQLGINDFEVNPLLKKAFGAFDSAFDTHLSNITPTQIQKVVNVIGAYQNMRSLWLVAVGSMGDVIGPYARTGGNFGMVWKGYKDALRAVARKDPDGMRSAAVGMGIAERHAVTESMAASYGAGDSASKFAIKANSLLFKYSGMNAFERFVRLASFSIGNRFILHHADLAKGGNEQSIRYMRELQLDPKTIERDPHNAAFVKINDDTEHALYRFVRESNITPNIGDTPAWFHDPHFALLAQYKSYMYAFYHTIVERMAHEVDWGNTKGMLPAAAYIAATGASGYVRGLIQYGPQGNPYTAQQGPVDYFKHLYTQSGLINPGGDVSVAALEHFSSPTTTQIGEVGHVIAGTKSVGIGVRDALPANTVWGDWFEHLFGRK